MGLLDQLWDETVAGPRPDSGLGRLRKYSSFSPSSSSSLAPAAAAPAVTRSITIARPPSLSVDQSPRGESYSSSVPSSPASAPDSPFATATTPKADSWRRLRRKPKATEGVGARRRSEEPHRVRLGGDQLAGPVNQRGSSGSGISNRAEDGRTKEA